MTSLCLQLQRYRHVLNERTHLVGVCRDMALCCVRSDSLCFGINSLVAGVDSSDFRLASAWNESNDKLAPILATRTWRSGVGGIQVPKGALSRCVPRIDVAELVLDVQRMRRWKASCS